MKPYCQATTSLGKPCRVTSLTADGKFCFFHSALWRDTLIKSNKANGAKSHIFNTSNKSINNTGDLADFIKEILSGIRQGKIADKKAIQLLASIQASGKLIMELEERHTLNKRLDQLEKEATTK